MYKKELIKRVADRTSGTQGDSLTQGDIEKVIDATLEVITTRMAVGEKVQLIGFGSFSTREITPTNPQTGLKLEPRDVPVFKAGQDLKDRVKAGY